jgi:uroporphyrinogen-III synthase
MTKVWITRTRPGADESAGVWRAAGFEPVIAPLLVVQSVPDSAPLASDLLIFTSKNAIDHIQRQDVPVVCVGDATAEHARKAGYVDVISVDGTSKDITAWVKANIKRPAAVCHVSGWHIRGAITEELVKAGYSATRKIVYRSAPRPIWPKTLTSYVALYSPLAARVFAGLAAGVQLSGLNAICISEATAKELEGLRLKSVRIANRPREDELIMAAKTV